MIAEGLLMYLDPEGVRTAVGGALTPGGTLIVNGKPCPIVGRTMPSKPLTAWRSDSGISAGNQAE